MIVDVDVLSLSEELRVLLESAEERGRVRASRLSEVLEPLELNPLETESVFRELEKRSIEVLEDRRDGDAPSERLPAPAGLEVDD